MKRFNIFIAILILFCLAGCRTMESEGSYAGAGTYPLDTEVTGEETVLATEVDATKSGGFRIVRIPGSNMPISTAGQAALDLKQDANTASTDSERIAGLAPKLNISDIDDTPVDGETTAPISSNRMYDHENSADAHPGYVQDSELSVAIAIDASGFDGNLSTTDDTVQELAQAVDDLTTGSGSSDPDDLDGDNTDDNLIDEAIISAALVRLGAAQTITGAWTFSVTPTFTNGMGPNIWTFESSLPSSPISGLEFATDAIGYDAMGYYGSDGTTAYYLIPFTGSPEEGYGPVWRDATGWGLEEAGSGSGSTIDDTAGDGDTDVNWSADKSYDEIATLTTLVNALQAAVDGAGLNAFTWIFTTPSSTPYYVNSTSATFSFSITDTSSSADPDSVLFQVNSGGYGTNDCGSLTGCTVSGLTENSSNTVQFQVSDDATEPNTGESQEFTVISDTTDPVNSDGGTDSTHDGSTLITLDVDNNDTNEVTCTYSSTELSLTDVSMTTTGSTGAWNVTDSSIDPNSSTSTIDLVVTCTDPAGNFDTDTYNVTYSAPAATPDYQWDLDDNTTGTTVAATYGGLDATLYGATNTSDVYDATTSCDSNGSFQMPSSSAIVLPDLGATVFNDGIFSIELTINGDGAGFGTANPRFIAATVANNLHLYWISDTTLRLYLGGSWVGDFTVDDINDTQCQYVRLVCAQGGDADGSGNDVALYQKTGPGSWALKGSFATFTNPAISILGVYGQSGGTNSIGDDTNRNNGGAIKIWNSVEMP